MVGEENEIEEENEKEIEIEMAQKKLEADGEANKNSKKEMVEKELVENEKKERVKKEKDEKERVDKEEKDKTEKEKKEKSAKMFKRKRKKPANFDSYTNPSGKQFKTNDPVKVDLLAKFDDELMAKLKKWLKYQGKLKTVDLNTCIAEPSLFRRLMKPQSWLFDDV